jgi:hypothetical protein
LGNHGGRSGGWCRDRMPDCAALCLCPTIYFPQVNGIVDDSPTGVLVEYLLGGALVGAIFGLYFSIIIGQDIVEDDAYFYEQSLENGKVLVAVPATPTNRTDVEKVLGLQHQFEVKPQTA